MPLTREQAAEFARKAKASGLDDDTIRVHLQNLGGVEPSAEQTRSARKLILNTMDYPGGVVRAAGGEAYQAASGQDVGADLKAALLMRKHTPGVDEMMKRAGVEEGGKLSDIFPFAAPGTGGWFTPEVGGAFDWTGRGVVGGTANILSDPVNLFTGGGGAGVKALLRKGAAKAVGEGGASALAKAGRFAVEPVTSTLEATGKGVYKLGVMPAEMEAAKYGKESLAPILMGEGIYASPRQSVSQQMDVLGGRYLSELERRAGEAGAAGGVASMESATQGMLAKAQELRGKRDPRLIPEAQALETRAAELMQLDPKYAMTPVERPLVDMPTGKVDWQGLERTVQAPGPWRAAGPVVESRGVTPSEARFFKTRANEQVQKQAWNPFAVSDLDAQVAKLEGQGMRGEELASIERALGPEARAAQEETNRRLGTILTTKERQAMHEATIARKTPLGQGKAAVTVANPMAGAAMFGAQALERGMTPLGYGIYQTSQEIPEPIWRQILLQNARQGE